MVLGYHKVVVNHVDQAMTPTALAHSCYTMKLSTDHHFLVLLLPPDTGNLVAEDGAIMQACGWREGGSMSKQCHQVNGDIQALSRVERKFFVSVPLGQLLDKSTQH